MKKTINIDHIDSYIEFMPDLVFIKNLDGEYTHCNSVYLNFVQKEKEEILGKTDYDFLPKESADKFFLNDQEVLSSFDPINFEDQLSVNDNNLYFITTKQTIYDESGSLIGILSILRDITETKQYQLIYEDNNELLEYINSETDIHKILTKIVNLSERRNKDLKCSILLLDENYLKSGAAPSLPTFYNAANKRFKIGDKVGSCGSAAFRKKRIIVEDINNHENWKPYLRLTQEANLHSCWSEPIFSTQNEVLGTFAMYSNKPSKPNEFQLKQLSSYAHLAALTIEKENKKIEADIQKRRLLQEELDKKTEDLQLFKQVVENINYGIVITKASNTNELLYVNKEFENITGYTKEEAISKNCNFLQNEDIEQKAVAKIKEALHNKQKIQIELRNYKKDGTLFYNFVSISPVYDKEHNITHFVGIQKDITNQKKQEALLAEQAKLASMGEMIGNIAHQWRQPLSVISTGVTGMQLQKEHGLLEDKQFIKTCDAINENVQYLSQTIDDFKNFIKNDSIQKSFNLSDNIEKCLSLVSGTIKNCNINIILTLDNTIKIYGFSNELIQCYMNIFNNAKDALIDKQEKFIFIDSYIKNNKVVITIKDNAGGIPEDIISKIFEPYFTTKHKYQGTGLGLHMTYNLIVDGMKGTLKVSNCNFYHFGKQFTGAEFVISLPMS